MIKVKIVQYDDKKWECIIFYKAQKHMYLKLRDNKVIVSAPFFITETVVDDFIFKNLPKISNANKIKIPKVQINTDNDFIYWLNEKYSVFIKYHSSKTIINFEDDSLVVATNLTDNNLLLKKIYLFLKKTVYPLFLQRLKYWSEFMKLDFKELKLKFMITKWGICQPNSKIITLNAKLLHFSYEVIDYVIIHELAHLLYPHHKNIFWKFVGQYCPDYLQQQKILKQNGD